MCTQRICSHSLLKSIFLFCDLCSVLKESLCPASFVEIHIKLVRAASNSHLNDGRYKFCP